jgi:hypothetical protein
MSFDAVEKSLKLLPYRGHPQPFIAVIILGWFFNFP